jgi:hypothetical protein
MLDIAQKFSGCTGGMFTYTYLLVGGVVVLGLIQGRSAPKYLDFTNRL